MTRDLPRRGPVTVGVEDEKNLPGGEQRVLCEQKEGNEQSWMIQCELGRGQEPGS